MLIQKMQCPRGCENATIRVSESIVQATPSNLLLEGGNEPTLQVVKICTCNCCGNTFETREKSDGRLVL